MLDGDVTAIFNLLDGSIRVDKLLGNEVALMVILVENVLTKDQIIRVFPDANEVVFIT